MAIDTLGHEWRDKDEWAAAHEGEVDRSEYWNNGAERVRAIEVDPREWRRVLLIKPDKSAPNVGTRRYDQWFPLKPNLVYEIHLGADDETKPGGIVRIAMPSGRDVRLVAMQGQDLSRRPELNIAAGVDRMGGTSESGAPIDLGSNPDWVQKDQGLLFSSPGVAGEHAVLYYRSGQLRHSKAGQPFRGPREFSVHDQGNKGRIEVYVAEIKKAGKSRWAWLEKLRERIEAKKAA